jgi:hypothetical protein
MLASCHSRTGSGRPEPAGTYPTPANSGTEGGPEHANTQTVSNRQTKLRTMATVTVEGQKTIEYPAC